ncbi:MAG: hypothetical protein RJA07_317 [Bacteroidota bacterium]|jgi:predicted nuclease of predicted toxin-antitoxin system
MKILLDECITKKLKKHFNSTHQIFTVNEMNWRGMKNGSLMKLCIDNGFEIIVTIDKNLMFQQNLNSYNIIVVVLNSLSSKVEELNQFILPFENQIKTFEPKQAYLIEK